MAARLEPTVDAMPAPEKERTWELELVSMAPMGVEHSWGKTSDATRKKM